jgi:hypothetical protein
VAVRAQQGEEGGCGPIPGGGVREHQGVLCQVPCGGVSGRPLTRPSGCSHRPDASPCRCTEFRVVCNEITTSGLDPSDSSPSAGPRFFGGGEHLPPLARALLRPRRWQRRLPLVAVAAVGAVVTHAREEEVAEPRRGAGCAGCSRVLRFALRSAASAATVAPHVPGHRRRRDVHGRRGAARAAPVRAEALGRGRLLRRHTHTHHTSRTVSESAATGFAWG